MGVSQAPRIAASVAAVDLGSNSFRLEIGQFQDGRFLRTLYLKETVRQGGGLDAGGRLSNDAMQRGWDCLARFGQHLTGFAPEQVKAVATQTLREALNRDDFLHTASRLLGFPIRVISGDEEAHLIYQGAVQANDAKGSDGNTSRIVLDIGGRSTEVILGVGTHVLKAASFPVGSVSWSIEHFADQVFTAEAFAHAEHAARCLLSTFTPNLATTPQVRCYGSAGTVNAVVDVLSANGFAGKVVTHQALDWLLQQLLDAGHLNQLRLAGLREDRKPIIAGGLSVLRAVFAALGIQQLTPCSGGLRHGLLLQFNKKA